MVEVCVTTQWWFGVILRHQPPKLSWRQRQHDIFRSLVFWFNVRFPATCKLPREPMLIPVRGCPRWSRPDPQAVSCSTSWGGSRVMTKCNGITIKQIPSIGLQAHKLLQPGTTVRAYSRVWINRVKLPILLVVS
ncbi:unnamed protein product [Ascophyllum nodosum]